MLQEKTQKTLATLRYRAFAIGAYFEKVNDKLVLKIASKKRRAWFSGLWNYSKVFEYPFIFSSAFVGVLHRQNLGTGRARRAAILFEKYPLLKSAYKLTLSFRAIYKNTSKTLAQEQFKEWKQKVAAMKIDQFNTVVNPIEYHLDNILNFFNNRSTNANAESFNSKIKGFRANLRGVSDVKFFLFRLEKLFA